MSGRALRRPPKTTARTAAATSAAPMNGGGEGGRDQRVSRNISDLSVRTKVWIEHDGQFVIGEGGLDLLDAISASASLREAARTIGWSYRHAWGYLRNAERFIGGPLTGAVPGKGKNRGTALTATGRMVRRLLATLRTKTIRASGPRSLAAVALAAGEALRGCVDERARYRRMTYRGHVCGRRGLIR